MPLHGIWKDCLARGGGPDLTAKLMTLLLEKKEAEGLHRDSGDPRTE